MIEIIREMVWMYRETSGYKRTFANYILIIAAGYFGFMIWVFCTRAIF